MNRHQFAPTLQAVLSLALVSALLALPALAVPAGGRSERAPLPPPASGAPAPSTENIAAGTNDAVPMDDATAEILSRLGMMPFTEKIPSEDFTLPLLGGDSLSLSDYHGQVVFLNFWATWCPPCREEMPSMQHLYDELRGDGLAMIAVNVFEDASTAQGFIDEMGFTYPVPLDRDGRVTMRYGVRAYPTTYLIDREGYVIGVRPGYHDWGTSEIIADMQRLLEEP